MYRVLVVDDETSNYQLLEKLVKWEEKGFEIVGFAGDGNEAIQMFEDFSPDLILMDIQLPIMDGLECIRYIRKENKTVKIIIISAYGDFSYAQKAIRYGVSDFLLKPVSRTILNQMVDKMKKELDEEKTETNSIYNNEITEEFYRMLEGKSDEIFEELSKFFWIGVSVEDEEGFFINDKLRKMYMEKMSSEKNENSKEIKAVIPRTDGKFLMAFSNKKSVDGITIQWLEQFPLHLQIYLKEENQNLKWWVKEFDKCDNYGFYQKNSGVYNLREQYFKKDYIETEKMDGYLLDAMESRSEKQLLEYVQYIFKSSAQKQVEPLELKNHLVDMLISMKLLLKKMASDESINLFRNISMHELYGLQDANRLLDWLNRILEKNLKLTFDTLLKSENALVFRTNVYTEKNYCREDFSAQKAADYNSISKNYFIRMYKELSGVGYWEYVTRLRMERAKELLVTTDELSGNISNMVGYSSEYHFSRKFKEYTGESPNVYRKNHMLGRGI